jgi:hypothetical protein
VEPSKEKTNDNNKITLNLNLEVQPAFAIFNSPIYET